MSYAYKYFKGSKLNLFKIANNKLYPEAATVYFQSCPLSSRIDEIHLQLK